MLQLIVDDAGGEAEPSVTAERHSPRTREALAAMFAERHPTRNMCGPLAPEWQSQFSAPCAVALVA